MDPKHRIYSLPYNGADPEWYLQETEKRKANIDHVYYQFNSEEDLKEFAITLARQVNRWQLEGLILSDYRVAVLVHALLPELEIHTSCNAYQWNLKQMEIWRI